MTAREAEALLPYALNERDEIALQAVIELDGKMELAAEKFGTSARYHRKVLGNIKKVAAAKGQAPDVWDKKTAEGFSIGKATVQYNPRTEETERIWFKKDRDAEQKEKWADVVEQIAIRFKEKRLNAITPPEETSSDLLTLITLTDFHFGMYAWEEETGASWDIKIAKNVLYNAIDDMIAGSPDAEKAILNLQGDFLHWDGLESVTPLSKHVVDADTRFPLLVDLSYEMTIYMIRRMLERYKTVHVIACEGNHDIASSVGLRKCMKYMFADNPRVTVDDKEFPYYAYLHGKTMLAFHHGHKKKEKDLPALFASEPRYREMWGKASYTYIHTGHLHSTYAIEGGGAIVERHPTLASRDAYAARGGWTSLRAAKAITYHKTTGEYSRKVVHPDYTERRR